VSQDPEAQEPAVRSRWDALVWPAWLPIRARLPLIAQIAGAAALVAALAMPRWSAVAPAPLEATPLAAVATAPAPVQPALPKAALDADRPAHLNLDVRHNFGKVDFTVTVDGARALATKIDGSSKRFGVFGKRGEKGYTATLDLKPGTRVVRVRVRSAEDKFDQTRVERFDLGSASVASMRIVAEKSGLSVFADRPAPPVEPIVVAALTAPVPAAPAHSAAPAAQQAAELSAAAELYRALRQSLIAVAGFVASAATGFLVQEFLRSRKRMLGL
jgi:hypothetical protein